MWILIILGIALFAVLLELVIFSCSILMFVYKIVLKCLVLNKAEEEGWKGLIPFYGTYVYYHRGFNHKTSIVLFVAETTLTVTSILINFMFRIGYTVYDNMSGTSVGSSSSSYSNITSVLNSTYSINSLNQAETFLMVALLIVSLILFIVNILNFVVKSIRNYGVTRAFGLETGFCICSIFFPVITNSILAFNSNIRYSGYILEWIPD